MQTIGQRPYQPTSVGLSPLPKSPSDTGTSDDDRSNCLGEAPILAACRNNNPTWLKELLKSDPTLMTRQLPSGISGRLIYPFYLAVQEGSREVVEAIFAGLNSLPERDRPAAIKAAIDHLCKHGSPPLLIAAKKGFLRIFMVIIAALNSLPEHDRTGAIKAVVNPSPKSGLTLLCIAAQKTYLKFFQVLIGALDSLPENDKAEAIIEMLNVPRTSDGATPLLIAVKNGGVGFIKVIIDALNKSQPEHDRADTIKTVVNAACLDGKTSLFITAENGNIDALNSLLEHGADPEKRWIRHPFGKYRFFRRFLTRTPLQAARSGGHKQAANLIETAIQKRKTNTLVAVRRNIIPSPKVTEATPLLG